MPALPDDEAKAFHREMKRVGRAAFVAALRTISPDALSVSALTQAERQQLRDMLAEIGT
jgi:hypothetical protein